MALNTGLEKIVHIIPLGYEIDRAVVPFQDQIPGRVYLLAVINNPDLDQNMVAQQQHFVNQVKARLNKTTEVITINTNMFELQDVIKTISGIIRKEQEQGNRISVNMSACGRLTSVGAVVAAMAYDVSLYYVMAQDYARTEEEINLHGLSICPTPNVKRIVNFAFVQPDEIGKQILVSLYKKGKAMRPIDIFEVLRDLRVQGYGVLYPEVEGKKKRDLQIRQLMKLDKTFLTRLERDKLIIREKRGRNVFVTLTESGRYMACLSGLLE